MSLSIEYRVIDGVSAIVRMTGSISLSNIDVFRNSFDSMFNQGLCFFLLDIQNMPYFASISIRELAKLQQRIRDNHGKAVFFGPNELVKETFQAMALNRYMPVFDNEQQALDHLKSYRQ